MTLRIIQMSDLHLMADPQAELKGIRTRERFERVLSAAEQQQASVDWLVLTGDLTHDERRETYVTLHDRLTDWLPRLRLIPGNHDDRDLMRQAFHDQIRFVCGRNVFVEDVEDWRLIGLDSHRPGELFGELGTDQLAWLNEQLASQPTRPTGLFVHHPPFTVHSPWLDRIALIDAESLLVLLRQHAQIRFVSCGHVHQEFTAVVGSIVCLATPATGVQFRPETETLEVDSASPAFRIFDLHSAGDFQTRIERVEVV